LLSWRDRSALEIINQLDSQSRALIESQNSLPLIPDYAGAKIAKLQAMFKDLSVVVATLDTYLIAKLSRGKCLVTEHSMAGHTLLYDFQNGRWSEDLCAAFGVDLHRLPEIRSAFGNFGFKYISSIKEKNSFKSLPFYCLIPDKQAALKGLIKNQQELYLDLGSTFSLCMPITEKTLSTNGFHKGYFTSVLFSKADTREYFLEALLNYPGNILNLVIKKECGFSEPEKISEFIEQVIDIDAGSAYFPIPSTSAPSWKYNQKCLVTKKSLSDKRLFVKALIEHMACGMLDCIFYFLEQQIINKNTIIKTSGGFAKIKYLVQLLSDLSGLDFLILDEIGGSAFGVASILLEGFEQTSEREEQRYCRIMPCKDPNGLSRQKQIYQNWQVLRDATTDLSADLLVYQV
jgi:glycerol kinase